MADGGEIQRMESFQYPATHVGHLNPTQQTALQKFEQLCEQKGYYSRNGPNGQPTHDDETMLRYLRARKFVPQDAYGQFKDTEDWRKENQIDKLYDTIDVQDYDDSRKLYPQWTGRRDRRGIPVYLFEVAGLNAKALSVHENSSTKMPVSAKVPPKMMRLFALYENLVKFALPLCSELPDRPYPETPVSQSNNIVDISNVGLKQFWNLKSHMQDASTLATAHYPETLDRIFIIGAPSFFPTVWSWVKKWFDPITVSKIFILSKADMKKTLEQYIEPQNIPRQYGGTLDYKFGDLPNLDPVLQKQLHWQSPNKLNGTNTIPTGPIRLERNRDGELALRAVGSEKGRPRDRIIATLGGEQKTTQPVRTGESRLKPPNLPVPMHRTTTGLSTHPPSPPESELEQEPPRSDSDATDYPQISVAAPVVGAGAATGGTYLAYRPAPSADTKPLGPLQGPALPKAEATGQSDNYRSTPQGSETSNFDRDGTTSTRYADQAQTHASGNIYGGSPNTRTTTDGDSYGIMDPKTVGQAPKEHPMPEPEVAQPSYIDQAKDLAGQAYNTAASVGQSALAAVGYGTKHEEPVQQQEEKRVVHDPAVDNADDINVEEFLRNHYHSSATQK